MLTVLMATRNRAEILREVLERYCQLQQPSGGWKLVVIDNASTDQTLRVIAAFANCLPLHLQLEPKLGKNFALNTGLQLVEGDLTVFTDDDTFPHSDWLVQLRKAADVQPAYTIFGGAVLPRWEVEPPDWLSWAPPGPTFTLSDPGWEEGPIQPVFIFGPNMAIRAEVFKVGTRFDTSIGPRGVNYPMGSETELVERLARQGHKAWHVQDAVVEHFIRAYQMDKSWIFRRAVRYGRGSFRRVKATDPAAYPYFLGMPVRLSLKLGKPAIRIAKAWLSANEQELFSALWDFNWFMGCTIEAFNLRHKDWIHGEA